VPFKYPSSPDTGPGLTAKGRDLVRICNRLGIVLDLAHLNERGFWDVAEETSGPMVVSHACANALCPTARNVTDAQIDAIGESKGILGINFHVGDLQPGAWGDPTVPVEAIVDHAVHVADRIGIEHVGFGSDFDGAMIPQGLKDAAGLPRLIEAFGTRGFSTDDVRMMAYDNWMRVLGDTWRDT
jgi:membrane dipeptidase